MSVFFKGYYHFRVLWSKFPFLWFFLILWYVFFALPSRLFERHYSHVLLDSNGALLNVGLSSDEQYRFPINKVPFKFKKALLQFEDQYFYYHPGISPPGILRAVVLNLKEQRIVSGASTISMQVVRLMQERKGKSWKDKILEIILATRLELKYSKEEILELYAAHAPFGGNIVGVEAASWRYFGKELHDITWAEAATLAVLPNAPSLIHPGKNRSVLLRKRNKLLFDLWQDGVMDKEAYDLSLEEPLPERPQAFPNHAFHLLQYYKKLNPQGGFYHTSLNKTQQIQINNQAKWYADQLLAEDIHNLGVLLVDNELGEVLAYVGNTPNAQQTDYYNDMILTPRSTGSTLKPFLFALALQKGIISSQSVLPDIPVQMGHYNPKNFDYDYEGLVAAQEALYRSLNIPMVFLLRKYGLSPFHQNMKKLGMNLSHEAQHYGMSLILGGAEVRPWDLCEMYANLAQSCNGTPWRSLTLSKGDVASDQIGYPIKGNAAYVTFKSLSMLQRPVSEQNWSQYESAYRISWKTGTSYGFRDAWAVGSNRKYTLCVWVGNADGEGKPGLTGVGKAAPLLFQIFNGLNQKRWFTEPNQGLKSIALCSKSGAPSGKYCNTIKVSTELNQTALKVKKCALHQRFYLDKNSGLRANRSCLDEEQLIQKSFLVMKPVEAQYYAQKHPDFEYVPNWLPKCAPSVEEEVVALVYPKRNSEILLPLDFNQKRSSFVAQAAHSDKNAVLQWFLDDKWIGETAHVHKLGVQCASGNHVLSVVDESGNKSVITFKLKLTSKNS